jgi:hypothetical protein
MASGYTLCPCCGFDTVSSDETEPELCSDCEEAGCSEGCPCEQSPANSHEEITDERTPTDWKNHAE